MSGQLSEQYNHENSQDFASLPCETFLIACRTENDDFEPAKSFNHKNQLYQSVHAPLTSSIISDDVNHEKTAGKAIGSSLLNFFVLIYFSWHRMLLV